MRAVTFLTVLEDILRNSSVSEIVRLAAYQSSNASTRLQRAILHRCCPIRTSPYGCPPEIPSMMKVKLKMSYGLQSVPDVRAFVPMLRDPLEVEVD
jgi:hypothetical protein